MKYLISLFCILISLPLHADEPDNVLLNSGEKAPYTGILLNLDRAERVRLMNLDLSTCTKVSSLKDDENKILQDRINNANTENNNLSQRLAQQKESGFWTEVGTFMLGAASASLIAYGASRAVR